MTTRLGRHVMHPRGVLRCEHDLPLTTRHDLKPSPALSWLWVMYNKYVFNHASLDIHVTFWEVIYCLTQVLHLVIMWFQRDEGESLVN